MDWREWEVEDPVLAAQDLVRQAKVEREVPALPVGRSDAFQALPPSLDPGDTARVLCLCPASSQLILARLSCIPRFPANRISNQIRVLAAGFDAGVYSDSKHCLDANRLRLGQCRLLIGQVLCIVGGQELLWSDGLLLSLSTRKPLISLLSSRSRQRYARAVERCVFRPGMRQAEAAHCNGCIKGVR